MKPLRSFPHILFAVDRDQVEQLHVRCHCAHCGDDWQRRCDYPDRVAWWVKKFAKVHSHGMVPR